MVVKLKLVFHNFPFLAVAHSTIRNPTSALEIILSHQYDSKP